MKDKGNCYFIMKHRDTLSIKLALIDCKTMINEYFPKQEYPPSKSHIDNLAMIVVLDGYIQKCSSVLFQNL